MSRLSPAYLPTITLTGDVGSAIRNNLLPVRRGQWVKHPAKGKGQVVRQTDGVLYVAWVDKARREGFKDRTQRFARAIWHSRNKHDPITAVIRAPESVGKATLTDWFKVNWSKEARAA